VGAEHRERGAGGDVKAIALDLAQAARADAGALGQRLLAQAQRQAVAAHQQAEGGESGVQGVRLLSNRAAQAG
jgi:hypothetical protein